MEAVRVYLTIKQTNTFGNIFDVDDSSIPLLFICHWLLIFQGRQGCLFMHKQNPVSLYFMWHWTPKSTIKVNSVKLVHNFDNYFPKCSSYTTSVKQSQPRCWSITTELTQISGQGMQYPAIRMQPCSVPESQKVCTASLGLACLANFFGQSTIRYGIHPRVTTIRCHGRGWEHFKQQWGNFLITKKSCSSSFRIYITGFTRYHWFTVEAVVK